MNAKIFSMKKILAITFFTFSVPALLLLFILSFYTIQRQADADIESYRSHLKLYKSTVERTLDNTENLLANVAINNTAFRAFYYADSQLHKHMNAFEVMKSMKILMTQEPLIGGFFLYSNNFSYYLPSYQMNYPLSDQKKIKDYLTGIEDIEWQPHGWIPFSLSDRIVLLQVTGIKNTLCAAIIDPSLDMDVASASIPEKDILLFFSSLNGVPYTSQKEMEPREFAWTAASIQVVSLSQNKYQLIKEPFSQENIQLCYMVPYKSILERLNTFQRVLLSAIALLFLSVPFIWLFLYRRLLEPLNSLMKTMEKVGTGDLSLRAPDTLPIRELRNFGQTFNQMLENIKTLKVETYEKKLDLQQAQLQYLQLQIRPHFYLNCLKGLYGMAEKKQYKEIQEMLLALSDYFSYIFRNNKQLVSLSEEIHSVSSYISLQQLNFSCNPELTMDIAADTADIPILPLSLLTFVENSVKHSSNPAGLTIHLKSRLVTAEDGTFLNLIISDNSGGFSPDALQILNHLPEYKSLYDDYHVGISNIYYRMELTYEHNGLLAFYNTECGGCAELFIPVKKGDVENECIDCR